MQRTATIVSALSLLLLATPIHGETVSEEYVGGSVVVTGVTPALYCDDACIGDDTGLGDLPNIAGATFDVVGSYGNIIIQAHDDASPSVGVFACAWNPDGDNICDDDDASAGWSCGAVALLGVPFGSGSVHVWVATLVALETLDICGPATTGTITADFF